MPFEIKNIPQVASLIRIKGALSFNSEDKQD